MATNNRHLYRVLIVNDDTSLAGLLAELFRHPGRSIEIRDSAFAAIQFVRQNPVDIVVLDPAMAGRDEGRLVSQIRQQLPFAHIVLCTGHLAGSLVEQAEMPRLDRTHHERFSAGEVLQLADTYKTE